MVAVPLETGALLSSTAKFCEGRSGSPKTVCTLRWSIFVDGTETVNLVEASGRQAIAVHCDVSSEQSVADMAAQVQVKFS